VCSEATAETRRCRFVQGRNASSAIRSTSSALREDLVAIADVLSLLRIGDRDGRGHVAGDPGEDGVALGGQLFQGRVLESDSSTVACEQRDGDRDCRTPAKVEILARCRA
jgi:hypothetical protein